MIGFISLLLVPAVLAQAVNSTAAGNPNSTTTANATAAGSPNSTTTANATTTANSTDSGNFTAEVALNSTAPPYPGVDHNMYGFKFDFPTKDNYYYGEASNSTTSNMSIGATFADPWVAKWSFNETGSSTLGAVYIGLFQAQGAEPANSLPTQRWSSKRMDEAWVNCTFWKGQGKLPKDWANNTCATNFIEFAGDRCLQAGDNFFVAFYLVTTSSDGNIVNAMSGNETAGETGGNSTMDENENTIKFFAVSDLFSVNQTDTPDPATPKTWFQAGGHSAGFASASVWIAPLVASVALGLVL